MRTTQTSSTPTPGFRLGAAGLLVPNSCSNARKRVVLSSDAEKLLKRFVMGFLADTQLQVTFRCGAQACPDPRIERVASDVGGFLLRCGCSDRVFSPALAVPHGRMWAKR